MLVLLAVRSQFSRVMTFIPSMHTPSDRFEISVALLTVWDMVKAVEKDENGQYPDTRISDIQVIKKEKI